MCAWNPTVTWRDFEVMSDEGLITDFGLERLKWHRRFADAARSLMPQTPAPTSPNSDKIEEGFLETLRQAAFIFEREVDGRFEGSILACKAVARFIYLKGGGAELAGPFFQIAGAFEDLKKGGKPRLFSKKSAPNKERERSPDRKHMHLLAAAALEVMLKLGPRRKTFDVTNNRSTAAAKIARGVNRWPGMEAQDVSGQTVIAWRNQQRSLGKTARRPFHTLVAEILGQPGPKKTVDQLIRSGPPRYWKS